MSTKIYNGIVIKNTTLEEVENSINNLRSKYITKGKELYKKSLASKYYMILDLTPKVKEDVVYNLLDNYIEKEKSNLDNGYRSTSFDFEITVSLKEHNGNVYGSFFSEKEELITELKKKLNICDYGYWDNTDKPDDLTATEWEHRSRTWDKLFDNSYSFEKSGFKTINIVLLKDFIAEKLSFSDIENYSIEKRENFFVKNKTVDFILDQNKKENPLEEISVMDMMKVSRGLKKGLYPKEEEFVKKMFNELYEIPTLNNYKTIKTIDYNI
jgi:hypothetical protein